MTVVRKLLSSVLAFAAAALLSTPAQADIPIVSGTYSVTATGASPSIPLVGQSVCSVVLPTSGTTAGLALVPQVSSDNGTTWVTATTIGGGSIATNGTFVGAIGNLGLTNFRLNVTALTSGSVTATYKCSGANPGTVTTSPSGTQNVNVSAQSLSPIVVSTPAPCTAATCTTAIGNGANTLAINAAGKASMTCAANTDCPVNAAQVGTWTMQPGNTANTTPWLHALCNTAGSACIPVPTGVAVASPPNVLPVAQTSTGAIAPIVCNSTAFLGNATVSTQILTANGSTKTYICDVMISAYDTAAGGQVQLTYGTGTTCGTGTTGLATVLPAPASTITPSNATTGTRWVPALQNVCLLFVGTTAPHASVSFSYTQM